MPCTRDISPSEAVGHDEVDSMFESFQITNQEYLELDSKFGRFPETTKVRFGTWTVLGRGQDYVSPKGVRRKTWLCECDCGTQKDIVDISGPKKPLCCRRCANVKMQRFDGCGGISGNFWNTFVKNARQRNHEVKISAKHAWSVFNQQSGRCALSGVMLTLPVTHVERVRGEWNASIDRIDSQLPYIENNIQWVDKVLNMMKRTLSNEEFIRRCGMVASYAKEVK